MSKFVYEFTEGNKDLKDLLGGKGANLAEMTNLGLPVPPGFTITTEACRHYLRHGSTPEGLEAQVTSHLAAIEEAIGRTLGDPDDPLLVSVRSGAKFSMPGMMDTVLNIGLSDDSVRRAGQAGRQRAVRVGLLPPADPDVRQDGPGDRRRAVRAARWTARSRPAARSRTPTWTRRTCGAWRTPTRRSSASRRAVTSRRTRASSWTWRSGPSSTRGTPTGPCSTAARSAYPLTSAPP